MPFKNQIIIGLLLLSLIYGTCGDKDKLHSDHHRARDLMEMGYDLMDNEQYQGAKNIFQQAIEARGITGDIGYCASALGDIYYREYNYKIALRYYLESVSFFKETNNQTAINDIQINAGLCFKQLGMYSKAAEYLNKSIQELQNEVAPTDRLIRVHNLLGNIYKDIGNYELALEHHQQSLDLLEHDTTIPKEPVINNIGRTWHMKKEFDSALYYYHLYLMMGTKTQDLKRMGRAYHNIAKVWLDRRQNEKAKYYLDSSDYYYSQIDYPPGILDQQIAWAKYYLQSDVEKSIEYSKMAIRNSDTLNKPVERMEALDLLFQAHKQSEDFQYALNVLVRHNELKDSLNNQEKIAQIYSYELVNRMEQKDAVIQKHKQNEQFEAQQKYVAIAVSMLLVVIAFLSYRRYLDKKRFVDNYFSSQNGVILKNGKEIKFDEILRVETQRNNLIIFKTDGKNLIEKNTTLKSFAPSLPKIQFGRPQRGIYINFIKVSKVFNTKVYLLEMPINITPKFKDEFMEQWNLFREATGSE